MSHLTPDLLNAIIAIFGFACGVLLFALVSVWEWKHIGGPPIMSVFSIACFFGLLMSCAWAYEAWYEQAHPPRGVRATVTRLEEGKGFVVVPFGDGDAYALEDLKGSDVIIRPLHVESGNASDR